MTSSNFLFKRETSIAVKIQKCFKVIFAVRHIETKIAVGGGGGFLCKSLLACVPRSELERPTQFST